ncbi:MAG: OmpA family protein [Alphaproteobacteria bacterium]|nr:OmpA family protein [Alphaproteobacteria bacterium]
MKALSRLVAAGALLGLAGCGMIGDTLHIQGFLNGGAPAGTDFNMCLAREYYFLTDSESKLGGLDGDYFHATRFMRKSRAASAGEEVSPWMASDWNVLESETEELNAARERLTAALAAGKGERPCDCARAQAHYDAWLEQEHDNDLGVIKGEYFKGPVQPDNVAAERFKFNRWVARCEGVAAEAKDFIVYFGYNKSNLTGEAMEVINEVANFVTGLANPSVTVVGHADTSGSQAYNQKLSERRAAAVARALSEKGVTNVTTAGKGEMEPAVPTGDGVREPLNRRATIQISQ